MTALDLCFPILSGVATLYANERNVEVVVGIKVRKRLA